MHDQLDQAEEGADVARGGRTAKRVRFIDTSKCTYLNNALISSFTHSNGVPCIAQDLHDVR